MFKVLIALLCVVVSGCVTQSMGPRQDTVVSGNPISYVASVGLAPTVVFESGLGDGFSVWADVYEMVQNFAGVFAYSRPGYSAGFNRQIKLGSERTADESAGLLREILTSSSIPAPYILVGHSIGGMYVLEFARDYPELVAGLVLVDARLPGFTQKCERADVAGLCQPPALLTAISPLHIAAEIRGLQSSEASAPSPKMIGNIPTILIAATQPSLGFSADTQLIWLEFQREYADALLDGHLVIAEGSAHYIQREAPELVVEEIRNLISRLR